jgi:hypothetical protein
MNIPAVLAFMLETGDSTAWYPERTLTAQPGRVTVHHCQTSMPPFLSAHHPITTHVGGMYTNDPLGCSVRFPTDGVDEPTTVRTVPGDELLPLASTPGPATVQGAPMGHVNALFTATGAGGAGPVTETVTGVVVLVTPLL